MKTVFLDYATVDRGDLDVQPLRKAVDQLTLYQDTASADVDARIGDAQVVLLNKTHLDAQCLARHRELKLICLAATGTDNVDLAQARAQGIAVCNLRDYCTDSVVQHVFAVMLTLARNLDSYRELVTTGAWTRGQQFCVLEKPIRDLSSMTLGIVGYGTLGQAVAQAGEAFGMDVRVSARVGVAPLGARTSFADTLRSADVLSLHCPLTDTTRGLLDAAALASMKPGALLINTARGAIVDSEALAQALRAGHLGGAAVDVLPQEPPRADEPLLAGDIPNLIVTPHIAWASVRARQAALDGMARNIVAFAQGRARNRVC